MQHVERTENLRRDIWKTDRNTHTSLPKEEGFVSARKLDKICMSREGSADLRLQSEQLLERLQETYPDITFEISSGDGTEDLKELAVRYGAGKHLVISESFLRRMSGSKEGFLACRNALLQSVFSLSAGNADGMFLEENQMTSWKIHLASVSRPDLTLPGSDSEQAAAQLFESLGQGGFSDSSGTDYRVSLSKTACNTSGLYTRLAQANSKRDVLSVMSDAQRNIAALRLTSCFGSPEEQIKSRKAIRSLQKLLLRGNQKNRRLYQETLLKIRKRRAQEKKQEARVRKIQLELKKRKTARKSVDSAIIFEGQQDEREIRRLRYYLSSMEYSTAPAIGAGGADMGMSAPVTGGMPLTTENISVSESSAF